MRYIGVLLALLASSAYAQHHEDYYNRAWCAAHGGQAEVVLSDHTRVDCLTRRYAVETDFGPKLYQAVGQAYHYASMTGKAPHIVLIVNPEDHGKYADRLRHLIEANALAVTFETIVVETASSARPHD